MARFLAALMLVPCAVAVASLAGRPWWPVDDFAAIDLRVRDVWSLHPPLTGLYSRPPWNHPGPLMFWLMSLVSLPAGSAPWATRVGGAVLQAVALGGLAWLAWRRGLRMLLAAAAVTAATYFALGPLLVRDPWNPNVPVAFFLLFLFLTLFVATGRFGLLVAMVAVGSFAVQTHVSYTPLVVAGFAMAAVCTLRDARRLGRRPPQWRSTLLVATGVALVCWIGPAIDVVVHWPGNLTKIAVYFTQTGHTHVGLGSAARIMASEFHAIPPWAAGREPLTPFTLYTAGVSVWWLLGAVALLAAGGLAARASRSRDDCRLVTLAGLMLVVGIVSISGADEARGYAFEWRVIVAVFVVVASLWSLATWAAPRLPVTLRRAGPALVFAGVAWGLISVGVAIPSARRGVIDFREPTMRLIARQLDHERLPHGTVLVRHTGEEMPSVFKGVLDLLDRRGVDVRVDPVEGRLYGYQRTIAPSRAETLWYVTEQGSYVAPLLRIPGAHVIARTNALPPTQEAELSQLQAQLWDQLRRAQRTDLLAFIDNPFVPFKVAGVPGVDPFTALRVAKLDEAVQRTGDCRCAVVAVTPEPGYPIAGVPLQP